MKVFRLRREKNVDDENDVIDGENQICRATDGVIIQRSTAAAAAAAAAAAVHAIRELVLTFGLADRLLTNRQKIHLHTYCLRLS